MSRSIGTLTLVASVFLLAPIARAEITVEQVGDQLYVIGSNGSDSCMVSQPRDWYVYVRDKETGMVSYCYDVSKVWVFTGNGDDFVQCYSQAGDVAVDTGNGEDTVEYYADDFYGMAFPGKLLIFTGNGADDIYAFPGWASGGGDIGIDTGSGADTVDVNALSCGLGVQLDKGDDLISGTAEECEGTVDGGFGMDDCSGLTVVGGDLSIVNCE